jgi:hypothetical protein
VGKSAPGHRQDLPIPQGALRVVARITGELVSTKDFVPVIAPSKDYGGLGERLEIRKGRSCPVHGFVNPIVVFHEIPPLGRMFVDDLYTCLLYRNAYASFSDITAHDPEVIYS